LGTNTVLSREALKSLAFDPRFSGDLFNEAFEKESEYEPPREKYEKDEFVD
jgi:hypothetical protein